MATYYVCNASRYMVSNLIPLLELGIAHIDAIILLVGANQPPTETDRTEALEPAECFKQVVQRLSQGRNIRVVSVQEPPQHYPRWPEALAQQIAQLGSGTYHVNVTAGTTAMTLGSVLSVLQMPDGVIGDARVFAYHPQPRRLIQIYPWVEERKLAPTSEINLDTYLHLYGLQEFEPRKRQAGETAALARMELTKRFMRRVMPQREIALSALNRIFAPLAKRRHNGPRHVAVADLPRQLGIFQGTAAGIAQRIILETVEDAAASVPDLTACNNGVIICPNEDAARYFAGSWFEEWTADRVREALSALPGAEVYCQLQLASRNAPANPVAEMDVAIFYRDQLHVVECKTALYKARDTDVSGLDYRAAIGKLNNIKRNWVGPFGTAAILNLREPPTEAAKRRHFESLAEEARRGSVVLWCGHDAADRGCQALIQNMRRSDPDTGPGRR